MSKKPLISFRSDPDTGFFIGPIEREETCGCFGLHGSMRPCPVHGPFLIRGKYYRTGSLEERDTLFRKHKFGKYRIK